MKIKYMMALIGRQLADQNTTTNQKQAAAMEGSMKGVVLGGRHVNGRRWNEVIE
jgi:hypothetical protein